MAIGTLTEEVALNLEEAAQATRRVDPRTIGMFLGGVGVGVAIGFFFGYRYNREKIKAEAFKESEEEVEKIRDMYERRLQAVKAQDKPSLDDVLEEKGYVKVVDIETQERPLRPPVPVTEPVVTYDGGKPKDQGWDYEVELPKRKPEYPYIIHQDEFKNEENEYSQVVYTYWAGDDVLTDETNRPLPNADLIVGIENLKWGHGSDDIDVVFIRNDKYELEIELCRTHESYEEVILGKTNDNDED